MRKQGFSKSFRRWFGRLFDRVKLCNLSEEQVVKILKQAQTSWSDKIAVQAYIARIAPVVHKYPSALKLLERSWGLTAVYFDCLKDAESNIELQRSLCTVKYSALAVKYCPCYPDMLAAFLHRWDLAKEVKFQLFADKDYAEVKKWYRKHRSDNYCKR